MHFRLAPAIAWTGGNSRGCRALRLAPSCPGARLPWTNAAATASCITARSRGPNKEP